MQTLSWRNKMNKAQKARELLKDIHHLILSATSDRELRVMEIKIDPDNSRITYYEDGKEYLIGVKTPTLDT